MIKDAIPKSGLLIDIEIPGALQGPFYTTQGAGGAWTRNVQSQTTGEIAGVAHYKVDWIWLDRLDKPVNQF